MQQKKIAWIQGHWAKTTESTLDYYSSLALTLKGSHTDLLVLPELFHTPYFPIEEHPSHFDLAITSNHSIAENWRRIAKEIQSVIVFPFFEKRSHGIYQNSVMVIERDGSVAGIYRKSHIPDDPCFYEKYYFMPGDTGFAPIQTSAGSLGVLICWDQWFPEPARILALQGAEILIYPTAIGWDNTEPQSLYAKQLDAWKTSMRAHSIANGVFTLAVNRSGTESNLQFWGNSFLCKPDGSMQYECNATELGLTQQNMDFAEIDLQRRSWPFMRDRRIDQYDLLLKKWCTP